MARWIHLVLFWAFIQNAHLFSPIEVPDEEWAAFNSMLRDPAYRLATTTRPTHYVVRLTPYFEVTDGSREPFTFDGEVSITIRAQENNVDEIVMHCNDMVINSDYSVVASGTTASIATAGQALACDPQYSFLRIRTNSVLQQNVDYVVRLTFTGRLQTNMRGFYRSWYHDSTGRRWMATTQFQPGHARQAFPCYDEPGFKATFDITIEREASFSPTISNMPLINTQTLTNGRVAETFDRTPRTSTYLLAFIVSHYEIVSRTTNATRPFYIYARDNAGDTGDWSLEIGELLLEAMEDLTQIPYYEMAYNMDMKQAAIPDFSAGAMENWGLLTYREALILYDYQNSNHFYKQRVANIVSHEITHMWFGNLVTCAWWDVLWLNEGFARYYQYYLTDYVRPDLGFDTRFIVEQVHSALFSDSLDSAHPLTDPTVNDPTSVSAHFSTITYARGAAVLRMTEHLLSRDTFVKGLRIYLKEREYDVAEPEHLFAALDAAAREDGALAGYGQVTVADYMAGWSEKAGHPLLTVVVDQSTGRMVVTQFDMLSDYVKARWERNVGISTIPSLWIIPVTWTRGGAPDFTTTKPPTMLTEQVSVLQRGTTGHEWVIFNVQQTGFYRVNYDDTNWGLITLALRGTDRTTIHGHNRGQIVDDVFALARAGVMTYTRALNILSFLRFENEYAPWIAAISGFNFLRRRLAHDANSLSQLEELIIDSSEAVTARLGFEEPANGTYMDDLLRMYLLEFLCNVGDERCVTAGRTQFQRLRNGEFIPANMRPWVYCVGLREGDATDFDYLWNRYTQEDLAGEKMVILSALGCTRIADRLHFYLNQIIADNDNIRPQDYNSAFSAATTGNEENTMIVLDWFRTNVASAVNAIGSVSTPLSYIAARLLTEEQIIDFVQFLDANQAILGGAYQANINNANTARENLNWSNARTTEMVQYFENGYQEIVLEEETTPAVTTNTPAVTTTTESPTTPDSASVVQLGVVALLVCLTINLTL
ncbi:Membrane alanyl aminopeptidase [Eumeta japonica]|uniref:Aminopeptidase n=1 Tax=Eumeta variegata TaxID=151549 RepID=A0A4C1W7C3_EUMVA|nr:Membrane alanyl aminopeptidase [Eumeta japonica]